MLLPWACSEETTYKQNRTTKKLALFGASFSFIAINYLEKSNYFNVR